MKYKQSLTYWGLSGVNAEKNDGTIKFFLFRSDPFSHDMDPRIQIHFFHDKDPRIRIQIWFESDFNLVKQ